MATAPAARDLAPRVYSFVTTVVSRGSGQAPTLSVVHVGPDLDLPGGMSAVIRTLVGLPIPGFRSSAVSTYRGGSGPQWRNVGWFAARLPALAMAVGRADVVHLHVAQGGSFVRKAVIAGWARVRRTPFVVSVHGSRFDDWAPRHRFLVQKTLAHSAEVLVLTERAGALVRTLVPRARVRQIVNFVDVPSEPAPPPREAAPVVLFAGEIGPRKGVDALLEAWPSVVEKQPTATLVLAGTCVAPELLRDLPPRVEVRGPVTREAVGDMLRDAHVATLPSRQEAMPMFVLEAAAAARPVVATPVCDESGIVGVGGRVVQPGDVDDLADALLTLIERPTLAAELGGRGWQHARQVHSLAAGAETMQEIYSRAIAGSREVGR